MEEPQPKRQRVDGIIDKKDEWEPVITPSDDYLGDKYTLESDVGITEFINQSYEGFDCILKYKYSDFVVNEVGPDGQIVVLKSAIYHDPSAPDEKRKSEKSNVTDKTPPQGRPSIDLSPLSDLFTPEKQTQLHDLYTSKGVSPNEVLTDPLTKDQRTAIHQVIRTVFNSKLESQATPTGSIRITCPKHVTRRSNVKWTDGEYTHFTLKKGNRDTMSTASQIAKWLKCHVRILGYAGTKDRRAITTQRMSAHRITPARLASLNKIANPMGIYLGDYIAQTNAVKLGDLNGNRFTILLREVPFSTDMVALEKAMTSLRERGFINYYGMQRFGTSLVSTHSVGALLLNGDWKAACLAILDVKAGGMNDSIVARQLYAQGNIEEAFERMPRGCVAERAVLGVLKGDPKHFSGALQAIPRNLRLMYVHAYQSYVWNVAASARMRLNTTEILEGDLVLYKSDDIPAKKDLDDPDAGGEFTLETDQEGLPTVKILTAEDVASGAYTIHDIVLPTPGYEVIYPPREDIRQAYVDTMKKDGLDPFNMRRVVREVSMVGHYRRIVHRPEGVQWEIVRYKGRETLLDMDDQSTEGEYMALRVHLSLGTSQYATMALREICKRDSVQIQYWGKEREEQEKARKVENSTV